MIINKKDLTLLDCEYLHRFKNKDFICSNGEVTEVIDMDRLGMGETE